MYCIDAVCFRCFCFGWLLSLVLGLQIKGLIVVEQCRINNSETKYLTPDSNANRMADCEILYSDVAYDWDAPLVCVYRAICQACELYECCLSVCTLAFGPYLDRLDHLAT